MDPQKYKRLRDNLLRDAFSSPTADGLKSEALAIMEHSRLDGFKQECYECINTLLFTDSADCKYTEEIVFESVVICIWALAFAWWIRDRDLVEELNLYDTIDDIKGLFPTLDSRREYKIELVLDLNELQRVLVSMLRR
jgi:hypothetical protein